MTAKIAGKDPRTGTYNHAWCDECKFGFADTTSMVRNWVYLHNANYHEGDCE